MSGRGTVSLHHRSAVLHDVYLRDPVLGLVRVRVADGDVEVEHVRAVERRAHDRAVHRVAALDVPIQRGIGPPVLHGVQNGRLGLGGRQHKRAGRVML